MNTLQHILLVMFVAMLLTACGKEQHLGKPLDTSLPALRVTEAIQTKNLGRVVNIAGTVDKVCQEEGCWLVISDGKKKLRVTFKDEAFTVPMSLRGNVILQGVVTEDVYDEETAQAMAESVGMSSAEINNMQGDQRIPVLVASGVYMETPPSE